MNLAAEERAFRKWSRSRVQVALNRGDLVREPCADCGATPTQAHHGNGYDNPIEVTWLCSLHHRARHPKASPPERVVRDLYLNRRYSDQEIAAALGVNRVTVTKWRKRWNIARDDRGPVEVPA